MHHRKPEACPVRCPGSADRYIAHPSVLEIALIEQRAAVCPALLLLVDHAGPVMRGPETVREILQLADDADRIDRSGDQDAVRVEDLLLKHQVIILKDAPDPAVRCLAAGTTAAALADVQRHGVDELDFNILARCFGRCFHSHQGLLAVDVAAFVLASH